MNFSSTKIKLIIGALYLLVLFVGLYFLFSFIDLRDLTSYELIRSNQDTIIRYKNNNLLFLTLSFFIFSVIWYLLLGFASPILIFSGFVFGKWFGILIALLSATFGTTLLYLLAKLFFADLVKQKLEKKFSNFKNSFQKKELFYFSVFRFMGGGGIPFGIQNILPVIFNISTKNYFLGTLLGCGPPMFVTVALGAGIENFIEKNEEPSFFKIITYPDIYLPIIGFMVVAILGIILKKIFFNKKQ